MSFALFGLNLDPFQVALGWGGIEKNLIQPFQLLVRPKPNQQSIPGCFPGHFPGVLLHPLSNGREMSPQIEGRFNFINGISGFSTINRHVCQRTEVVYHGPTLPIRTREKPGSFRQRGERTSRSSPQLLAFFEWLVEIPLEPRDWPPRIRMLKPAFETHVDWHLPYQAAQTHDVSFRRLACCGNLRNGALALFPLNPLRDNRRGKEILVLGFWIRIQFLPALEYSAPLPFLLKPGQLILASPILLQPQTSKNQDWPYNPKHRFRDAPVTVPKLSEHLLHSFSSTVPTWKYKIGFGSPHTLNFLKLCK